MKVSISTAADTNNPVISEAEMRINFAHGVNFLVLSMLVARDNRYPDEAVVTKETWWLAQGTMQNITNALFRIQEEQDERSVIRCLYVYCDQQYCNRMTGKQVDEIDKNLAFDKVWVEYLKSKKKGEKLLDYVRAFQQKWHASRDVETRNFEFQEIVFD